MTLSLLLSRARVAADERGTALLEFAMIAPVLIFMTTAGIDLGYVVMARSQLESAVALAARQSIVSNGQSQSQRQNALRSKIAEKMVDFALAEGEEIEIDIRRFSNFSNARPEPFTDEDPFNEAYDVGEVYADLNGNGQYDANLGTSGSMGSPGDVVGFEVTYALATPFGFVGSLFEEGHVSVQATAVVRNEPI